MIVTRSVTSAGSPVVAAGAGQKPAQLRAACSSACRRSLGLGGSVVFGNGVCQTGPSSWRALLGG
ncbi:hypothetical protein R1CP_16145 [Rhodococcus opacus]|uniref:Uncharacterized protein n=1 Tax=Rhodococcus opacus TaxID=37919 RepID=A0A1B1K5N1_RHOOP|nr:hypothetical protein R1CP_16145 [Rhodococcus opacus]